MQTETIIYLLTPYMIWILIWQQDWLICEASEGNMNKEAKVKPVQKRLNFSWWPDTLNKGLPLSHLYKLMPF